MTYHTLELTREPYQSVDVIFQLILKELKDNTTASGQACREVADRLSQEVGRICTESKRIQDSGDVLTWATALARHRLQQCLHYYKLGSRRGRVDLHSTLSAVVYRYITPSKSQYSYQARLVLIEDFLQSFYMEALNAFRREMQLGPGYTPRSALELAEYMAFTERYAKRRIPLPGRRTQQLIILRAQTFSQQQPNEALVDIERAAEGALLDSDDAWNLASMQQLREQMVSQEAEPSEDSLRQAVVQELIAYLEERNQKDCVDYFVLRLRDLPANEIEAILGLTPRQRDYLQQRFKYHLVRFTFTHRWELVHQWLEIDLDRNLGLSFKHWQEFQTLLNPQQKKILQLKKAKLPDADIARQVGCTPNQLQKQWFKILEFAWERRNTSGEESPADPENESDA
ncbi:MAG: heterocyst differentiation protein HetZ [Synechococcales bacterium]|nr:heterocyst differentiation protein HetZ [Synechococcales bacterium]